MTEDSKFPVALGLPTLLGPYSQEYGAVMAGSFLSTLPIIVVFLIAQRRFIEAHLRCGQGMMPLHGRTDGEGDRG